MFKIILKTGVILFVIIYLFLLFKKFKSRKPLIIFINTVFFIYICAVAQVAFFPLRLSFYSYAKIFDYSSCINIMPFKDLILALTGTTRSLHESVKEILLNAIMLMPFGFLFPIVFRRNKFKNVLFATFAFSLIIETSQLLMKIAEIGTRTFDTTDLITNTIGGCIGYLFYVMLRPLISKATGDSFDRK